MKITQNLMRVKELLLNPPTFSDNQARLQTNLDTDFLKLIAIVSMLIDHIGSVFFPEVRVLRWICLLYTSSEYCLYDATPHYTQVNVIRDAEEFYDIY